MMIKVVIPARYGSSRLPGKPLLELNGKPMFWHVAQRVLDAGVMIDDIVIATDDNRIYSKALELYLNSEMTSPSHASGTDRTYEVTQLRQWADDTFIINVQGDEPQIPSALIKNLIDFSQQNRHFDITTVATPIKNIDDLLNPNIVKCVLSENNRALYFSRAPVPFDRDKKNNIAPCYRHIGIYGYQVKNLRHFCSLNSSLLENIEKLEQLRALSNNMSFGAIAIDHETPHGIDTYADYIKIKELMEK